MTLGHGAIVHNATIHDWAIIGMGSIVSDWSVIGEWAEGAVVKQRDTVPPDTRVAGVPARPLDRRVDETYKSQGKAFKQVYVDLASRYPAGIAEIPPASWSTDHDTRNAVAR